MQSDSIIVTLNPHVNQQIKRVVLLPVIMMAFVMNMSHVIVPIVIKSLITVRPIFSDNSSFVAKMSYQLHQQ